MSSAPSADHAGLDGPDDPNSGSRPASGLSKVEPHPVETPWLTASEQTAWRAFVDGFQSLMSALDRQLQEQSQLTHSYYEILLRLSAAPGRSLRMSELADATLSSRSRLSHAVGRLEERGWLLREDFHGDRRGQLAHLTDAGLAALRDAVPGHVTAVRSLLLDNITDDQLQSLGALGDALVKLTADGGKP